MYFLFLVPFLISNSFQNMPAVSSSYNKDVANIKVFTKTIITFAQ